MSIEENVKKILAELHDGVRLVAAAKTRSAEEIMRAVSAGVKIIGENYVQEAEEAFKAIGGKAEWHFIGHLQRNKVKRAVEIFDMIETVDSVRLAAAIGKRARVAGKTMPVLIEINSGREPDKSGVYPERAEELLKEIAPMEGIKVEGLMTMGPVSGSSEEIRPYFVETKKIFDKIKKMNIANSDLKYLSMGMTGSYRIAVEEGANIVRIGSKIFGERNYDR